MIPQETVQKILDTARIEEVIGDFVTLRRRGDSTTASAATREDPP